MISEFSLIELTEENMALNDSDRAWIRETIAESRKGWKETIRFWSLPSVSVAILIAVFSQWTAYVEFRTKTTDTLAIMQAEIRTLQAPQSPGKVFKDIAPLPPKEFVQNLPALRKASEQPPKEAQVDPEIIRAVAQQLRSTNENTSDYWPTVLQFLNFASLAQAPQDIHPQGVPTKYNGVTIVDQTFQNQVVILTNVNLRNVTFERCIVFLEDANTVTLRNVTFRQSRIELPVLDSPSARLRMASIQLLASNLQSATLNVE